MTVDCSGTRSRRSSKALRPRSPTRSGSGKHELRPDVLEGVPEAGRERLRRLQESGRFFTSDLSVNEFLLVEEAGFEPMGFVMGSSFFHIGIQLRRWSKN